MWGKLDREALECIEALDRGRTYTTDELVVMKPLHAWLLGRTEGRNGAVLRKLLNPVLEAQDGL